MNKKGPLILLGVGVGLAILICFISIALYGKCCNLLIHIISPQNSDFPNSLYHIQIQIATIKKRDTN